MIANVACAFCFLAVITRIFGLSIKIHFTTSAPSVLDSTINGFCAMGVIFFACLKVYVQPDILLWFSCGLGLVSAFGLFQAVDIKVV